DHERQDGRQNRPANEDVGGAHGCAAARGRAGSIVLSTTTGEPLESRFCPAVTTSSPALTPSITSTSPSLRRPVRTKIWATRKAGASWFAAGGEAGCSS